MTEEELRDEDGEAIGGLEPDGAGVAGRPQSRRVPMSFPVQQSKLAVGDDVVDPHLELGADDRSNSMPRPARCPQARPKVAEAPCRAR